MRSLVIAALALATLPALADEVPLEVSHPRPPRPRAEQAAPPVAPDPNASITLTFGELNLLMAMQSAQVQAQTAQAAAAGVVKKIEEQVKAKAAP